MSLLLFVLIASSTSAETADPSDAPVVQPDENIADGSGAPVPLAYRALQVGAPLLGGYAGAAFTGVALLVSGPVLLRAQAEVARVAPLPSDLLQDGAVIVALASGISVGAMVASIAVSVFFGEDPAWAAVLAIASGTATLVSAAFSSAVTAAWLLGVVYVVLFGLTFTGPRLARDLFNVGGLAAGAIGVGLAPSVAAMSVVASYAVLQGATWTVRDMSEAVME